LFRIWILLNFGSPRGSWGIKNKTMKNLAKKLMIVSAFAFCAALVVPLLSQAREWESVSDDGSWCGPLKANASRDTFCCADTSESCSGSVKC